MNPRRLLATQLGTVTALSIVRLAHAFYPATKTLDFALVILHLFVAATSILLLAISLVQALRLAERARREWLVLGLASVFGPVSFLAVQVCDWPLRRLAFQRVAQGATPLVEAVTRFTAARGKPPSALGELVPDFLPAVPGTGLPAFPRFEIDGEFSLSRTLVYDLGSPARFFPPTEQKPPEVLHSNLLVEIDGDDRVTKVWTDFVPLRYVPPVPFDEHRWHTQLEDRITMARDFAKGLPPTTRSAIVDVLGSPTRERRAHATPWVLRVDCGRGMLNWDVFVYWPTLDYPTSAYGGSIERIGDWAYVHE